MKLSVLIPSRGRPGMLPLTVNSLLERESGKHDITYVIGADADDPNTIATAQIMRLRGAPVRTYCRMRGSSLGDLVNRMSLEYPADAYCSLCDDIQVETPGWDARIAEAWQARPWGVWFWKSRRNSTYAIVSEKWRAAAGRIFTDYFPFWWDDVWLIAVWRYATGEKHALVDAWLDDSAPNTTGMRDLRLWTDFFWSQRCRDERKASGKNIARILGLPPVRLSIKHELAPSPKFMREIEDVEASQGDRGPPPPQYLKAKARVLELMAA